MHYISMDIAYQQERQSYVNILYQYQIFVKVLL